MKTTKERALDVARILADSGGRIVGKTRLQKAAYFLERVGLGFGFPFYYKHYGPYSDELSSSVMFSESFGFISHETKTAAWGGEYVVFNLKDQGINPEDGGRARILEIANTANPVALELAATAVFLQGDGSKDPWNEVKQLKPAKATSEHVKLAKQIVSQVREVATPKHIPEF